MGKKWLDGGGSLWPEHFDVDDTPLQALPVENSNVLCTAIRRDARELAFAKVREYTWRLAGPQYRNSWKRNEV